MEAFLQAKSAGLNLCRVLGLLHSAASEPATSRVMHLDTLHKLASGVAQRSKTVLFAIPGMQSIPKLGHFFVRVLSMDIANRSRGSGPIPLPYFGVE